MLNLTPHHRLRVPNGLAVLAAVLLLVSTVAGFHANSEIGSNGTDTSTIIKADSPDQDDMDDGVVSKRRGLNLGFLFFRRG